MKSAFYVLALFAVSAQAVAKGSSHPTVGDQSSGGMISWSDAQRVVSWNSDRHWHTADGTILICPWDAKAGNDKECVDKKNEKVDRWVPLTSYSIPGFQITGFQYFYVGSYGVQQLVVYYGAVKPAAPVLQPAAPAAPTFTGPITIKADRVVVQRRK